ncbi:hypothetical protein [Devosia sp. FJ2-5-3]|jgi:hypothetical protein|uniref:hypothetical protein n=1 Tax=Devosia sp. FJ2-5-3 TaxID=2976680 RepID=UPI0023D8594B|nr:hypothetical protein [Devosia sp. FJ2-5-3]WEJ59794.1 hypothetical protein N0P34_07145 [Devosia sp. FJ2-5-3]
MASISKISQMTRWQQMEYYRSARKEGFARVQQFSATANSMMSIKTNEAIGKGNVVAKVAFQRMSKTA